MTTTTQKQEHVKWPLSDEVAEELVRAYGNAIMRAERGRSIAGVQNKDHEAMLVARKALKQALTEPRAPLTPTNAAVTVDNLIALAKAGGDPKLLELQRAIIVGHLAGVKP